MRSQVFHEERIDFLPNKNINGRGMSIATVDLPKMHAIQQKLICENKYIVKNLTNLEKLPPVGSYAFCAPINMQNAPQSPNRAVALVPKQR